MIRLFSEQNWLRGDVRARGGNDNSSELILKSSSNRNLSTPWSWLLLLPLSGGNVFQILINANRVTWVLMVDRCEERGIFS